MIPTPAWSLTTSPTNYLKLSEVRFYVELFHVSTSLNLKQKSWLELLKPRKLWKMNLIIVKMSSDSELSKDSNPIPILINNALADNVYGLSVQLFLYLISFIHKH